MLKHPYRFEVITDPTLITKSHLGALIRMGQALNDHKLVDICCDAYGVKIEGNQFLWDDKTFNHYVDTKLTPRMHNGYTFYVLYQGDQLVSLVSGNLIQTTEAPYFDVLNLVTLEPYRKQGHATRLFNNIFTHLVASDIHQVKVAISDASKAYSLAFYQKVHQKFYGTDGVLVPEENKSDRFIYDNIHELKLKQYPELSAILHAESIKPTVI